MSNDLLKAILSMDAYNRSYNQGIELTGTTFGGVTIIKDSEDLGFKLDSNGNQVLDAEGNPIRKDADIGFYAIAYEYQGEVIISYRGTDVAAGRHASTTSTIPQAMPQS